MEVNLTLCSCDGHVRFSFHECKRILEVNLTLCACVGHVRFSFHECKRIVGESDIVFVCWAREIFIP